MCQEISKIVVLSFRKSRLTALFVLAIGAVLLVVAELGLVDAKRFPIGRALWTHELVARANRGRAAFLVGPVVAVVVRVALIRDRNAEGIRAPKLVGHTSGKTCAEKSRH